MAEIKDGWDYIDETTRKVNKYSDAAKDALSKKDYTTAISNYEQAIDSVDEMVREIKENNVNLLQGMIASANSLRIIREKYSAKVKKLEKKAGRQKLGSGLLKRIGLGVIVSFIISTFFLQSNLTGLTISNLNQSTSNWIGTTLLFMGIIGSFFYFNRK